MSSHDHNEHGDEVKGSPTYDPSFGRGTIIGIGIFVILFAAGLVYADMNYVHSTVPKAETHSSQPAPQH